MAAKTFKLTLSNVKISTRKIQRLGSHPVMAARLVVCFKHRVAKEGEGTPRQKQWQQALTGRYAIDHDLKVVFIPLKIIFRDGSHGSERGYGVAKTDCVEQKEKDTPHKLSRKEQHQRSYQASLILNVTQLSKKEYECGGNPSKNMKTTHSKSSPLH